ncbi:unnamed protein product [Owenia fusiformis]|uniref:Uncharacterized protein n=1 Tax=Owenia fusiformis TaxID=6347 RepID=A0A8J1TD01_OWEFU|nr:unnamed protein product [Owenia fusiformis]
MKIITLIGYITLTLTGVLISTLIGGMGSWSSSYGNAGYLVKCGSRDETVTVKRTKFTLRDGINDEKEITSQNKTRDEKIPRNITKVIILTYRRSGSSFFAELLKQNPGVFFIFEPLVPVAEKHGDLDVPIVGPAYIREILNCRFGSNSFLNQSATMKGWRWQSVFRGVSDFKAIPKVCLGRGIVATKIIRLRNIGEIAPFFDEDTAILSLARDPRGILNSRNKENVEYMNQTLEQKKNDMKVLCYNMLTNINFIHDLDKSKKRLRSSAFIKQVLYEDFAMNPLNNTKELYKTLNIEFHEAVQQWIEKNTSNNSNWGSVYGTSRNSSSLPSMWRHELSQKELHMIQNITNCSKVIKLLGFQK